MSKQEKYAEILKRAKARFKRIYDHESTTRELMRSDLDAYYGDIWEAVSPGYRKRMEAYDRPVLSMGQLKPLVRRVVNDVLSKEPMIKTIGRNNPDKEKAERFQGLIRHIMYNSDAQEAIGVAVKHAAIIGRGHFRILTDYADNESNAQSIMFEPIKNPFNVYFSPSRKGYAYTDADYCFIVDRMLKEDFKLEYPDAHPANWESQSLNEWMGSDDLMVAEYFEFETKRRTLLFFEDGSKAYLDEVEKEKRDEAKILAESSREVMYKKLMWYKMTSQEILEEREIPGSMIPICTIVNEEGETSDGRTIVSGIVREAKNAAWLYDLDSSLEAENAYQNSINPWIADPETISGFEHLYAEAHIVPRGYLPAKTVIKDGVLVPRPERVAPIPVSGTLYNAKMAHKDDMYSASGITEERMGMQSNAQSGRAVIARSQESRMTNSQLPRSVGTALTYAGRIINKWIPEYYDTKRIVQILDIEMKPETIEINSQGQNGEMIDLGDAYDDIIVTMGPGYLSGRMEGMESMMQFIQAIPGLAPIISDLIAENSDWPGSQKIAERIRATMPPEVLAANGGADQIAMQLRDAMQKLQASHQLIEMMKQALDEAQSEIQSRDAELSNNLQVEQIKAASDIQVAEIKATTDLEKAKTQLWAGLIKNPVERRTDDDRE